MSACILCSSSDPISSQVIFCSNDDPIFGHTSLSNTEELWPSSKDLTSSPDKSIPMSIDSPSLGLGALRSTSEKFETKAEYMLDRNQPFARAYGEVNNITPNVSETLHAYAGGKNFPIMKEKVQAKDMLLF